MSSLATEFVSFAIAQQVLRFGQFTTKAGRASPYFFNAGLFNDGASINQLGAFYAQTLLQSGLQFDILFGPAYKGIPLVTAIAMQLAQRGKNVPFAYNRKETKDHGEGGQLVGAPLAGRVLVVDDVISAGTSVRDSVALIKAAGAQLCGVLIALDRQERGTDSPLSATQQVQHTHQVPVIAIATIKDVLHHLGTSPQAQAIEQYLQQYGMADKPA